MATTITMPQLGETVTEGTVAQWLKKVGDRVEKYEAFVEVSTDKVNAEVPVAGDRRHSRVARQRRRDGSDRHRRSPSSTRSERPPASPKAHRRRRRRKRRSPHRLRRRRLRRTIRRRARRNPRSTRAKSSCAGKPTGTAPTNPFRGTRSFRPTAHRATGTEPSTRPRFCAASRRPCGAWRANITST